MSYLIDAIDNSFLSLVGLNIETFLIIIILCVAGIALSVDYRIALITLFFLTVVAIIFLILINYPIYLLLVLLGLSVVLLAMSIFVSRNQNRVIA
jgi:hypothetical protein